MAETSEEVRKQAAIRRSLGNRSNITVCIHGINKYHCKKCDDSSKPVKAAKVKKAPKAVEPKAVEPKTAEA